MSDADTRDLMRRAAAGEPAARLAWLRVRMRELPQGRIRLRVAAGLGHAAALTLEPDTAKLELYSGSAAVATFKQILEVCDQVTAVRFAADCAERCLPRWEWWNPEDRGPRAALEAARAWTACPCRGHAAKAEATIPAAYAAAFKARKNHYAAAGTIPHCAKSSVDALLCDPGLKSVLASVLVTAARAGLSDLVRPHPRWHQAGRECPTTLAREEGWQRSRLAACVLGEVS